MELDELKIRHEAMTKGAWAPLGNGREVKVRSARIPENRRAINRATNIRRKGLGLREGKQLPIEEVESAIREAAFGTILVDWRGINRDGQAMEFTRENYELICELDPGFLDRVLSVAADDESFDVQNLELVEGD